MGVVFRFFSEIFLHGALSFTLSYSVHVEWTSTNTCDENLMKGPGEAVKKSEMKKINKLNTKAYKYEMGVQNLFHVKLAHNFMPEMEPKCGSPVPEKCPDL